MIRNDDQAIFHNGVLRIGREQSINLLVTCLIAYSPIDWCLNAVVNRFVAYGAWWDSAITLGLLLIVILLASGPILSKQKTITLLVYVVFLLGFGVTIFLGLPGKDTALSASLQFFTQILSYFLVGYAITDFARLEEIMVKSTKIVVWATLIWTVLTYTDVSRDAWQNNMSMAYGLLPSAMFSVYYAAKTRFREYKLYFGISLVLLVALGTRGPILLIAVFTAYALIKMASPRKKFLWIILIGAVIILVGLNFYSILEWVNDIFLEFGIKNAAVQKMLETEDWTNGRMALYTTIIQKADVGILMGQGLFADREYVDRYVHMLPLELCVNFGYFWGILICILIIWAVVWGLKKTSDDDFRFYVMAVGVFVGVFKLLMSNSYLSEPYFYLWMGMVFKLMEDKQNLVIR